MSSKPAKPEPRAVGPIESGVAYPISSFKRLAGWGDWAMREARKAGLKVRVVGNTRFVIGDDFLAFLRREDGDYEP